MTVADKPWTQPILEDETIALDTSLYSEDYDPLGLGVSDEAPSVCYLLKCGITDGKENELSSILLKKFFATMVEKSIHPSYLVLINSGVLLAQDGSPIVESLKILEETGVSVLVSEESAAFYQMGDNKKVGRLSPVNSILVVLHGVDKVITL